MIGTALPNFPEFYAHVVAFGHAVAYLEISLRFGAGSLNLRYKTATFKEAYLLFPTQQRAKWHDWRKRRAKQRSSARYRTCFLDETMYTFYVRVTSNPYITCSYTLPCSGCWHIILDVKAWENARECHEGQKDTSYLICNLCTEVGSSQEL